MSQQASDDVQAKKATRAEFATRLFIILLLVLLVASVVTILLIRSTQVDRTPQNEKNDETLAIIKDCTQPAGKCYKRGQAATAEVLASVQRIIVLSAACAVTVDPGASVESRVADITACVTKGLTTP